jgi:hypothetical protein
MSSKSEERAKILSESTASMNSRSESSTKIKLPAMNKRYFNALVKPNHNFLSPTDLTSRSSLIAEGSIFSSLPLYDEEVTPMDPSDFRTILATNPYRMKNKEISYIMPEKIVKK